MKKKPTSLSGIFNFRVLVAFGLCVVGSLLAMLSVTSTSSGSSVAISSFGGPDPTTPGVPRYQNFYAPAVSSAEWRGGEFNIGFNPFSHHIFTMSQGPIWAFSPPELDLPAKPESF